MKCGLSEVYLLIFCVVLISVLYLNMVLKGRGALSTAGIPVLWYRVQILVRLHDNDIPQRDLCICVPYADLFCIYHDSSFFLQVPIIFSYETIIIAIPSEHHNLSLSYTTCR